MIHLVLTSARWFLLYPNAPRVIRTVLVIANAQRHHRSKLHSWLFKISWAATAQLIADVSLTAA